MRTLETIQQELDNFEGDKRSKEYKMLKEELNNLSNTLPTKEEESPSEPLKTLESTIKEPYDKAIYDKLMSYRGRIPKDDVKWFFESYNKIFGTNKERCNCPGTVSQMMMKLKATYNRYLREVEKNK